MLEGLSNSTGGIFSPDTELSLNKFVSQIVSDDYDHVESSKSFGFNVNAVPFYTRSFQPFMRNQDKTFHNENNQNYNEALDKLTAFALGPDVQNNNGYHGEVFDNEARTHTMRFGSYSSDASSTTSGSSDQSFNNYGSSLDSGFQDAPICKPIGRNSMIKNEQYGMPNSKAFGQKGGYSINNALSALLGNNVGMKESMYRPRNNVNQHHQYEARNENIQQPGRQIRGSSARNVSVMQAPTELNHQVERANAQLRYLEKDRKKVFLSRF